MRSDEEHHVVHSCACDPLADIDRVPYAIATIASDDFTGRLGVVRVNECVIYTRVSTDEQRQEGYSLPAQLEAAEDFAARNNLRVVARFEEAESAAKTGRPEFGRMLRFFVDHQQVRTVVVHKLDRLARNFRDLADIEDLGVRIRCVSGDAPEGPAGSLYRDINMAFARNYSINLSHEVTKGQREKAKQGGWLTRAPVGYLNDKANRRLVVDPIMGPLVQDAFRRYATGLVSISALGDEMYAAGLRNLRGGRVARASLHAALKNPVYCGKVCYRDEIFPGMHEPLVTMELFEAVQAAMLPNRTNNAQKKHIYALRDFLTCKECGCKITAGSAKGHVYYRCSHGKGRGSCGQSAYIREEALVDQIARILDRIAIPDPVVQALLDEVELDEATRNARTDAKRVAIERALTKNEHRRSILVDLRLDGEIDEETYSRKHSDLQEESSTLLLQLRELEIPKSDTFLQVERLLRAGAGAAFAFKNGSDAQKREVLSTVLCYLHVEDRNIASYQYKRPFDALQRGSEGAFCLAWSG